MQPFFSLQSEENNTYLQYHKICMILSFDKSKKSVCQCVCVCLWASNISADQDQTASIVNHSHHSHHSHVPTPTPHLLSRWTHWCVQITRQIEDEVAARRRLFTGFLLVENGTTPTNHKIIWQTTWFGCWGTGGSCGRDGGERVTATVTVIATVIVIASYERWKICDV